MATNPMDYCPSDDTRSCENCVEYDAASCDCTAILFTFEDGEIGFDPSFAEECSLYQEVTRGN